MDLHLKDGYEAEQDVLDLIVRLIEELKPKLVLETGTHKGYSAIRICEALKRNKRGRLVTYDIKDFGQRENLAHLSDWVTCKIQDSKELNEEGIDLAFLDGDHFGVVAEWEKVKPRLSDRAVVVWDNASLENQEKWGFRVREILDKELVKYLALKNGALVYEAGS